MDVRKLARFKGSEHLLACPVCGEPLSLSGASLICEHRHSFDLARQGYVNLLQNGAHSEVYDRASFENRRQVFESGLYDPLTQALKTVLSQASLSLPVVDAGCGEGYFARALAPVVKMPFYAFDISKDSIRLAASEDAEDGILWFVADLADIPLLDKSVGCVLDIFSPANYAEFGRILVSEGIVVKVIPTKNHLHELRERVSNDLRGHGEYSNTRVVNHFEKFCTLLDRQVVTNRAEVGEKALRALIHMTPLLFKVDVDKLAWDGLTKVTMEAEVLVGQLK